MVAIGEALTKQMADSGHVHHGVRTKDRAHPGRSEKVNSQNHQLSSGGSNHQPRETTPLA